jgi:hypothetical protein
MDKLNELATTVARPVVARCRGARSGIRAEGELMRAGRRRAQDAPRRTGLLAGLVALALLTASACSTAAGDETVTAGSSPRATPLTNPPAAASAGVEPDPQPASPSSTTCSDDVGAQLRERTTVAASGLVTVLGGSLPCAAVGVWAGRFSLDSDPALDPAPQFGTAYTGSRPLAVRLPATTGRCTASAVFFTVDASTGGEASRGAVTRAASQVRTDLRGWPTGSIRVVPGGSILRGRSSTVLAATVVGDPSACTPGESVSIPVAAVGDCWTALPQAAGTASSTATVADDATRFRRTTCGEAHTHEVYWAESLTPKKYLATGKPAGLGAAAWARRRAGELCAERSTSIELADDVTRADIYLEYLWPGALSYPPRPATAWAKAQVVCLARWKDAHASTRHLLHQ